MTPHDANVSTCCAVSYGHPLVRWLLGESFHPGGLALTERLAAHMGVGPGKRVLDLGSGLGASAVHLARTTGCHVTGVTLEREGIEAGLALAERHGVADRVVFVQGDIMSVDLPPASFDHILLECVLSILQDKSSALDRTRGLLAANGTLGLSDVTVCGPPPEQLRGPLGTVGCIGDALSMDEYRALAEANGFAVLHAEDCRAEAAAFLRNIKRKLLVAGIGAKLGKVSVGEGVVAEAKRVLQQVQELVKQGSLGYGLLVARDATE